MSKMTQTLTSRNNNGKTIVVIFLAAICKQNFVMELGCMVLQLDT